VKAAAVLGVALLVMLTISICLGTQPFSVGQVADAVGARLGIGQCSLPPPYQTVICDIRLPRAVLAILVGGALGLSGALMQGLFRNPLADPGIIGVSSGGAFGAVLSISLGWAGSMLTLPIASMAGSCACALLAFSISARAGRAAIVSLLLAGLAINALANAGTSFLLVLSEQFLLRDILGWMMGTLDARTWTHVAVAAPFVAAGAFGSMFVCRELDLLAQGEEVASSLGVNLIRIRLITVLLACMTAGAAVAVCGVIGFVGLVVPHVMRLWVGPSHGKLAVNSFLGGGLLLLLADLASRVLPGGGNIRLGILTAFIGVPFFLFLLRDSTRRENYA
jgi:iron complex transport system permease protein